MRLCFSASVFPARSQTFVTSQVLHALRAGHEVTVVCQRSEPDDFLGEEDRRLLEQAQVVRWPPKAPAVHRLLPRGPRASLRAAALRRSWQRQVRADVVVAHFGGHGTKVAAAQRDWSDRPPLVTIFHGRDVSVEARRNGLAVYRHLFEQGDLHLTVNRPFAERLLEGGAPPERVAVHHLGVPVARYPFTPRPTGRPLRLVSVCRLVRKKGLDVAIEALALFHARYPQIDWTYEIGGEGPEHERLAAQVAEAGLGDRVKFLGPMSHADTLSLVAAGDALLLPSVTAPDGDQEGIPVTLMEAMALGTPVCTTRHSGIPELVTHGETGLLSEEGDAEGLFASISLLVTGQVDAVDLARAARRKVERDFDEETRDAELLARCEALCEGRRAPARSGQEDETGARVEAPPAQ